MGADNPPGNQSNDSKAILGYINHIPPESKKAREARHRRVAERRKSTIVMVHRGADAFAPENSLEAYAAAMDYGADGVEIDIRRSKDGVLYMHHDDELGRTTGGSGKIGERTYAVLLQQPFHNPGKTGTQQTRIPTLAAVLELARQRAMLLHLDIKEAGCQEQMIAMFDEADVWDHIVHINPYNSDKILQHPSLELYQYKGWLEEAGDVSKPEVAKRFLDRPGQMIFCKRDPRTAVKLLGRSVPAQPVPLPKNLRIPWPTKDTP